MYYVENKRYNTIKTIGCCMMKRECKDVIAKEMERMKKKGITKIGEFYIRAENEQRIVMRVKNSRDTWNKKEFASTDYGNELEYQRIK